MFGSQFEIFGAIHQVRILIQLKLIFIDLGKKSKTVLMMKILSKTQKVDIHSE